MLGSESGLTLLTSHAESSVYGRLVSTVLISRNIVISSGE